MIVRPSQNVLKERIPYSILVKRTDGTWILSMIVPQKYDENGRVVSVLLANRDFTEEKK